MSSQVGQVNAERCNDFAAAGVMQRPGSGLTIKYFVFQSKASARIDPGRAGLPQAQSAIHVEWIVDCPGMFRIFMELRHFAGPRLRRCRAINLSAGLGSEW